MELVRVEETQSGWYVLSGAQYNDYFRFCGLGDAEKSLNQPFNRMSCCFPLV
jgi:hypothetical protein